MHQLLSMGAINGLPEDIQWAIRMMLPRKEEAQTLASDAAAKPAAEAALAQLVPSTAYLPYLLQPQQLAVLTQHAQQVGTEQCLLLYLILVQLCSLQSGEGAGCEGGQLIQYSLNPLCPMLFRG